MRPINIPACNVTLTPPAAMPECAPLKAAHDAAAKTWTTFWTVPPDEAERIKAGYVLEVTVLGDGHPPIALAVGSTHVSAEMVEGQAALDLLTGDAPATEGVVEPPAGRKAFSSEPLPDLREQYPDSPLPAVDAPGFARQLAAAIGTDLIGGAYQKRCEDAATRLLNQSPHDEDYRTLALDLANILMGDEQAMAAFVSQYRAEHGAPPFDSNKT